jgi:hypothetical protein
MAFAVLQPFVGQTVQISFSGGRSRRVFVKEVHTWNGSEYCPNIDPKDPVRPGRALYRVIDEADHLRSKGKAYGQWLGETDLETVAYVELVSEADKRAAFCNAIGSASFRDLENIKPFPDLRSRPAGMKIESVRGTPLINYQGTVTGRIRGDAKLLPEIDKASYPKEAQALPYKLPKPKKVPPAKSVEAVKPAASSKRKERSTIKQDASAGPKRKKTDAPKKTQEPGRVDRIIQRRRLNRDLLDGYSE